MCCFWLSGDSRGGGVEGIVDDDDIDDDDVVMFIHKLLSFCMCLALILQHRGSFLHRELFNTHERRSICFTRSQLQLDFCSHHYYQLFPWHPTTIRNSISTHFFNCKRIVVRFTVSQLFYANQTDSALQLNWISSDLHRHHFRGRHETHSGNSLEMPLDWTMCCGKLIALGYSTRFLQ